MDIDPKQIKAILDDLEGARPQDARVVRAAVKQVQTCGWCEGDGGDRDNGEVCCVCGHIRAALGIPKVRIWTKEELGGSVGSDEVPA